MLALLPLAFLLPGCGAGHHPDGGDRTADRAVASAPAAVAPTLPVGKAVERHGITWQFDRSYTIGAFANGDPWVVGPVKVTAITPACATVDGRVLHGAMVDPDPSVMLQGYDSALFGQWTDKTYDAGRNVAARIAGGEPLALRPGQSLVSVISKAQKDDRVPQLLVAAVLTCLDAAPAKGAFRPPYCKADPALKAVRHFEKDLDHGALAQLQPVRGMAKAADVAAKFERLWLDQFPSWVGRLAHPIEAMPDYGRDLAALTGTAALVLNSSDSRKEKRELLIRFVQLGIDTHALVRSGCRFAGNGGHASGRKFPILLAGAVLHDEQMLAIGRDFKSAYDPTTGKGTAFFGEDSQTFIVAETAPGEINFGKGGYDAADVGTPEWGFAHSSDPGRDVKEWDGNDYRRCCTANAWLGYALAARAMGLVEAWNHDPFFAYVDRYMQQEHRKEWRAWVPWHATMWDKYRREY